MKKFLVAILAVVGTLTILSVFVLGALGLLSLLAKPTVPRTVVVEIDFHTGVIETLPDDPLGRWMLDGYLQLRDVVDAIDAAAADDRVVGLVARIGSGGMGLAHLQEVRDAVARFRAADKPTVAFAETFGEFGPGNGGYYLATAFETIYMQPSGDVGLTGVAYQSMFIRGALEKLGIEPRLEGRKEYKNAINTYTERGYTEPHREAMESLLSSQFDQIVRGVAEGRGLGADEVRALIDRGPFLGEEALEARLVDGLRYRDEVYDEIRESAGKRSRFLYADIFLERSGRPHRKGPTVALIHGFGAVLRGRSGYSPVDGSVTMGSDSVAAAFRAAVDDRRVEAILFRVDSPGGSYVASDTIRREAVRAQSAGKPVIVSMGNVAGSGGYFVAMDADKIVAQPGTITASIGVYAGKMLTSGLWDKLGISWDEVHQGEQALFWSATQDYSRSGEDRLKAMLDRIYGDFTGKVAEGRGLELEEVLEVAKGRIWTGEDAKELGLVDELGGYDVALRLVREAIGLEPDAPVRVKRFPRTPSRLEAFVRRESESSEDAAMIALRESLRSIQPLARVVGQVSGPDPRARLATPGVEAIPLQPFASPRELRR